MAGLTIWTSSGDFQGTNSTSSAFKSECEVFNLCAAINLHILVLV